jgi:hypothetical protein
MRAWRPTIGQAPTQEHLPKLVELQKQISALIDTIPKGSVAQSKVDALQKTLDECLALGPTAGAVQCLSLVKAELEVLSESAKAAAAPDWPLIVGGVAAAGLVGWLLFGD